MRVRLPKGVWVVGLFFAIAVPAMAASEYPDELGFLADIPTPKYLSATATLASFDSTGKMLVELPVQFYWDGKSQKYAMDIRGPAGGANMFMLGVADTVWMYNFMHGVMLTAFRNQSFSWATKLPFTAEHFLALFSIFPDGFIRIDSFHIEDSLITIKSDRTLYSFDRESKQLQSIRIGNTEMTFRDFTKTKKRLWPRKMILNQPLFTQGTGSARINIVSLSFKRQRKDNLFDVELPPNMKRAFDLRNVPQPPDSE